MGVNESLRMRVVEAGARAIEQAPGSYTVEMDTTAAAEAALDAVLDCLTENMDEWKDQASFFMFQGTGPTVREQEQSVRLFGVDDLIRVLRERDE